MRCPCAPLAFPLSSIVKFEADLKALGGDVNYGRGSMMHLILTLCRRLEEAFGRIVDGKKDGKFCFHKSSSGVV